MSNKLTLQVGGKTVQGYAQSIKGKLWIHLDGVTYCTDISSGSRKRRSLEGKSSTDVIHAPMPGKVTKVFVEPGQKIEIGQAVVVMEAMKMEYTLKSEMSTTVESIQVNVGDQVQLGQALVKLKPLNSEQ